MDVLNATLQTIDNLELNSTAIYDWRYGQSAKSEVVDTVDLVALIGIIIVVLLGIILLFIMAVFIDCRQQKINESRQKSQRRLSRIRIPNFHRNLSVQSDESCIVEGFETQSCSTPPAIASTSTVNSS